jgi:hypothetical protein
MIALWEQDNPQREKQKNLGNIRLDIETDLKEFEKENPSRRISDGFEATTSEQQQGTSARNVEKRILNQNKLLKINSNLFKIISKTSLYQPTLKRKIPHNSTDDVSINILLFEKKSLMVIQLTGEVELKEIRSDVKFSKISDTHFLYENNQKLSQKSTLKKGNHFMKYY